MTDFSDVEFADVGSEEWATAVGHGFVDAARLWIAEGITDGRSNLTFEKCWISSDLSLLFTYQLDGASLGGRFTDLHICPLTGYPLDLIQQGVPYSAGTYAMNLFDGVPVGACVPRIEWTGLDGRRWWGDVPERGWVDAVFGPRLVSIR